MKRGCSYQDVVVTILVTHLLQILAFWLFTLTLQGRQGCLMKDFVSRTQATSVCINCEIKIIHFAVYVKVDLHVYSIPVLCGVRLHQVDCMADSFLHLVVSCPAAVWNVILLFGCMAA